MEEVYGPRPKRDMITQSATPINAASDIANGHVPKLQKHSVIPKSRVRRAHPDTGSTVNTPDCTISLVHYSCQH